MQYLQPNTTLQGGKYRIEKVLGQGGFGITYLAIQNPTHKRVAIKELFVASPGQALNTRIENQVTVANTYNQVAFDRLKEKFKKEASRLSSLNHPNLVKVYDTFDENNTVYYVMDYIEGESLRDKSNREGKLSEGIVLSYLKQLLPALKIVHKHSIWHLDIKPENIMVDKNSKVYLVDFGASKHIENSGTLTTSSILSRTPGYYPPEQSATTMRNIGAWTDIYALGATLYNLLTRFSPPTFDEIISEGEKAFSFSPNISQQTKSLIIRMMKVNRNERPQSVDDVLKIIDGNERTLRNVGSREKKSSGSNGYNINIERKIQQEAEDLKYQLMENFRKNVTYPILVICYIVGAIAHYVLFVMVLTNGRGEHGTGSMAGDIFLALLGGGLFGLLVGTAIITYGFDSKKILQDKISQWKKENPNDPRGKYL